MALFYTKYPRRGLSSTDREKLYDRCRGENEFPLCNIPFCGRPVRVGERWVESHFPVPFALGGTETGIAHARCNKLYAEKVEVPAIAKAKRGRQKFIGAYRTRYPMPGGRDDTIKRTMSGRVVKRGTR